MVAASIPKIGVYSVATGAKTTPSRRTVSAVNAAVLHALRWRNRRTSLGNAARSATNCSAGSVRSLQTRACGSNGWMYGTSQMQSVWVRAPRYQGHVGHVHGHTRIDDQTTSASALVQAGRRLVQVAVQGCPPRGDLVHRVVAAAERRTPYRCQGTLMHRTPPNLH